MFLFSKGSRPAGPPSHLLGVYYKIFLQEGGGGRGIKLITHLDPMPRMRISGATFPLPRMYSRRTRWQRLRKKCNVTDWQWGVHMTVTPRRQ